MLRGFREWLEEDPIGRFCMLNRRNYTRNGHDWNPMPQMELESLRGGVRIFGRGAREKGDSDEPPPPGYGPGISHKILKETVEQISTPLAHVFNMPLQEGIVPLEWKEANIIPLFKKGSRKSL